MNTDNFLKEKYIAYYNLSTGEIYQFQQLFEGLELNIEESIELFKEINNIDEEIGIKYFSYDDYDKIFEPDLNNLVYVDIERNNTLRAKYSQKKNKSSTYLWSNMDPQRKYSKEQVKKMYLEDYVEFNLKNILTHQDKFFKAKFISLDKLILREDVMSRNWDTYFQDPYLAESSKDKTLLAQSIMENGTFYPIQVTLNHDQETYMVREGNHRIASLKLGQSYDIVPSDYKILCIIIEPSIFSHNTSMLRGVLSEPLVGRYNIDPIWTTKTLVSTEYYDRVYKSIEQNGEKLINEYTVESEAKTLHDAYQFIYIYPLFLRDLLYMFPEVKPSPILNDEKLFNEWIGLSAEEGQEEKEIVI